MSKAAKRKQKRHMRGRPCREDVARTESGRISRAANSNTSDAADKQARDVRMRQHGLTKAETMLPEGGTVIGRMKLKGDLSADQYDALMSYQMTRERYMIAIRAPDSLKTTGGGNVMAVVADDADALAIAAWDRVRKVVQDAQNYERRNLWAALQFFIVNDEYHDHMVSDLRTVANVLFRYYALARNRQIT